MLSAILAPGDVSTRVQRMVQSYLPRLRPGVMFSHVTAALLYGVPLPSALEADGRVHVTTTSATRPGGRNVVGHRDRPENLGRPYQLGAAPLVSPATAWAQLATVLDLPDLVAAGDHLIRDDLALATLDQLRSAAEVPYRHGRSALLSALPLLRVGAESRQETLLRLTLADAGIADPVLQHVVHDPRGRFVARLDLAFPAERVGVEFDGDHHRTDRRQFARDIERLERLATLGWRVVRVTGEHARREQERTVARVRDALRSAPPSPSVSVPRGPGM